MRKWHCTGTEFVSSCTSKPNARGLPQEIGVRGSVLASFLEGHIGKIIQVPVDPVPLNRRQLKFCTSNPVSPTRGVWRAGGAAPQPNSETAIEVPENSCLFSVRIRESRIGSFVTPPPALAKPKESTLRGLPERYRPADPSSRRSRKDTSENISMYESN